MKHLSESLREQWNRHGYVLLRQHLSAAERAALEGWVDELASWPESPGNWMKWYERSAGGRQLCRMEDFLQYHAPIQGFLDGPELRGLIAELIGEPAVLYKEKINFKLPGGSGFAPHQDAPAFVTFGQRYHVTMMIGVDATTQLNGCLEVVNGFHGAGLLPQANDATLDPEWSKTQAWEAIETEPGDLLFFDSYVPHRSGPNRSDRPRRALYVTYNRASDGCFRSEYFARKRAAFPPECERRPGVDYQAAASVYNVGNPIL